MKHKVKLKWCNGFDGTDYWMEVGESIYGLNDTPCGDSVDDKRRAKERAKQILSERHPDLSVDMDRLRFTWGGCL